MFDSVPACQGERQNGRSENAVGARGKEKQGRGRRMISQEPRCSMPRPRLGRFEKRPLSLPSRDCPSLLRHPASRLPSCPGRKKGPISPLFLLVAGDLHQQTGNLEHGHGIWRHGTTKTPHGLSVNTVTVLCRAHNFRGQHGNGATSTSSYDDLLFVAARLPYRPVSNERHHPVLHNSETRAGLHVAHPSMTRTLFIVTMNARLASTPAQLLNTTVKC